MIIGCFFNFVADLLLFGVERVSDLPCDRQIQDFGRPHRVKQLLAVKVSKKEISMKMRSGARVSIRIWIVLLGGSTQLCFQNRNPIRPVQGVEGLLRVATWPLSI